MYDAKLGRFLSPDNYIQEPFSTQSFNRYGYVWNNPLKFTDPSGEFFWVAVIIGAVIGAASGAAIAHAKGAQGFGEWFGYILGGAAIGALSGLAGGATAGALGSVLNVSFAGTIAGAIGGAVGGAIAGGGFAALSGNNIGEGIWKGALSGFVGGGVGAYIGGSGGAFAGGFSSGGLGAALDGGNFGDILKGGVIGGALAFGASKIQQRVAYKQYNKGTKPFGNLTRQGFRKINVASQRSFARGREAGGWVLRNGDVGKVNYGKKAGVTLPAKPTNATANFHTHPNSSKYIQYHSLTDIVGETNQNYVISRQNIYVHDPSTSPLPSNYNTYTQSYIYNTLIPSLISTIPYSLNYNPFNLQSFGTN